MENRDFYSEFEFLTSRSSGAGGQNVNKVSTKVMLCFNVNDSKLLSEDEKKLIQTKAARKINSAGVLQIVSQKERSQPGNKELCIKKFYELIEKALKVPKNRKKTRPPTSSVEARLKNKKKTSELKQKRKKIEE